MIFKNQEIQAKFTNFILKIFYCQFKVILGKVLGKMYKSDKNFIAVWKKHEGNFRKTVGY